MENTIKDDEKAKAEAEKAVQAAKKKDEALSAEELDTIAGGGLKSITDLGGVHGGW